METKTPLDEPPAYQPAPPVYTVDYGQTPYALANQSPIEIKDPNFPPQYPTSSLPCYPTFGLPPDSKFIAEPQGHVAGIGKAEGQNDGVPQSFGMHLALACIATWLCVFPIGLAAFIFAMLARDRALKGRHAEARSLARTSIGVSIASVVAGACIIAIGIMMAIFVNPPGGGGGAQASTTLPSHVGDWVY